MASDSRSHENLRPGDCGVCLSSYEEKECRPRTLPCGHTFCSTCLSALIKNDHLTCPNCCANHWAPSTRQFPICYALEDMIRAMKTSYFGAHFQDTEGTSKAFQATDTDNKQKATVGLSMKMKAMVEEQKVNMKSLETKLEQELDQLNQYRAQLAYSLSEHGHMIEELGRYVQKHQATINLLQEEDVNIEAVVEEGKEVQRELKDAQRQLDQVTTASQAIDTTVSIDSNIARVELWLQHMQKEIPNGATLSTSYKVLETTKVTLELVSEDSEAPPVEIPSGHLNCTIMEAAKNAEGRHIKAKNMKVGGPGAPNAAPQQQQGAAVQGATTGPQAGAATGSQDYSQQWIEYYRSQGMHAEANKIKAQIKASKGGAGGPPGGGPGAPMYNPTFNQGY